MSAVGDIPNAHHGEEPMKVDNFPSEYATRGIEDSTASRSSPGDSALRWLAAFLVTAIGCSLMIMQSSQNGVLALPPVYDDISYFNDGARRLVLLYQTGLHQLIANTLAGPPHAPLSTGLAFAGFALFGLEPWAAVAANALMLFLFIRLFYWAAKDLPIGQTTLLAVALLATPMFGVTLLECRPDMFCAFIIACGALYIISRPWVSSPKTQVIAGVAFAAALWSKPTVFPLTAALFFAAMFFAALPSFAHRQWRGPIVAGLCTTVVAIILASPYYIVAWRHVVDYIWTTVFGSEAAIWVKPLPLRESILFYLTGPTGRVSLGAWLYLGGIIGVSALVLACATRRRTAAVKAVQILAMVAVVYLAVTIPTFKGPHGLPFAAIFLCAAALAAVHVATWLPKRAAWTFCIAVAVLSAAQFQWPYTRLRGAADAHYAETRWDMVREAFSAIGPDTSGKTILLTTSGFFLNPSVLEFEYYKRGLAPPVTVDIQRRADVAEHKRNIEQADIVFTVTPDFKEVFPSLPTATPEFRAKDIELVEASGLFGPAIRIEDPVNGGAILIYKKRQMPLRPFPAEQNIGPVEGPYPQWSLPRVRWGSGTASHIYAKGTPGATAKLVVQARTVPVADQTLAIFVNGEQKLAPVKMTYGFQEFVLPFAYDGKGAADIELRYGVPAPHAVLYKTLYIED
jgi:hypothetical protein